MSRALARTCAGVKLSRVDGRTRRSRLPGVRNERSEEIPAQVSARAKVGDVHVLRLEDSGRNAVVTTGVGGGYVIDARVGAGRIDVVRAG